MNTQMITLGEFGECYPSDELTTAMVHEVTPDGRREALAAFVLSTPALACPAVHFISRANLDALIESLAAMRASWPGVAPEEGGGS